MFDNFLKLLDLANPGKNLDIPVHLNLFTIAKFTQQLLKLFENTSIKNIKIFVIL